ncbi:uncharacterized protein LOC111399395 [Olea europaea var. sylvestris]|uniref:uncharacterized protein LOC111399395 n=1 Tax=Olea europaea var. sylvestris TaxID=158386 RepID=UPI000C1CFA29|nr:uncharacterized protein LOC111399395 [Olea europaea var. sylvestris]
MEALDLKSYKREDEVEKKEISKNEGVMRSEDSLRCCSCFSFLFPSGSHFDLFRVFRKKYEEDFEKSQLAKEPGKRNLNNPLDVQGIVRHPPIGGVPARRVREAPNNPLTGIAQSALRKEPSGITVIKDHQILDQLDVRVGAAKRSSSSTTPDFKKPVKPVIVRK